MLQFDFGQVRFSSELSMLFGFAFLEISDSLVCVIRCFDWKLEFGTYNLCFMQNKLRVTYLNLGYFCYLLFNAK